MTSNCMTNRFSAAIAAVGARSASWLLPFVAFAAVMGCSSGSLPARADPERAKQALRTALETWQKGESTEALANGSPPIYFNDPKIQKGMRLASYEVENSHDFFGQSVRFSVKATFARDDGGKERKLTYLIDTGTAVVIVPD